MQIPKINKSNQIAIESPNFSINTMLAVPYLTKSDFKVAQTCATKLYYKKLGYPTTGQNNNYTKILADGGFIVAKMAQLLFPEGKEINSALSIEACIAQTKIELQRANVTLFEPVIYAHHKLIRVDILVKRGNHFQLIEVKSKSFDSAENEQTLLTKGINIFRNKRDGSVGSVWKGYLEDITFQTYVFQEMLQEMIPDAQVTPYLCMPDKAKTTNIENLASYFSIKAKPTQQPDEEIESPIGSKFRGVEIDYSGNLEEIQANHILTMVDVTAEVKDLMPSVMDTAKTYLHSMLHNGLTKLAVPISKNCKGCEFRSNGTDSRDGFKECWGDLAEVEPHILDLYQVGRVGGHEQPTVNLLIQAGKVSLYDMPIEQLEDGTYKHRQMVQIQHTRHNTEWISENLSQVMERFSYPLHFIDFETSRMAIPCHAGMRPYEQVAFQWSCHTIAAPNTEPIHTDWINLSDTFPNFQFAEALMAQIGESGTIFTWATHENSVLRAIYEQMEIYGYDNEALKSWLSKTVKFGSKDKSSTLVDMNALTLKHYFHPLMQSKTALKCVLPAIWTTNSYLHQLPWLTNYFQEKDSQVLSPYEVLPAIEIGDRTAVIKEGTAAMLAYQDLLYGQHKDDPDTQAKWRELLRQYCCLDTMAMVIIWTHWNYLVA